MKAGKEGGKKGELESVTLVQSYTHDFTFSVHIVQLCHHGNREWHLLPHLLQSEPAEAGEQEGVAWGGVGPGCHLHHAGCRPHRVELRREGIASNALAHLFSLYSLSLSFSLSTYFFALACFGYNSNILAPPV